MKSRIKQLREAIDSSFSQYQRRQGPTFARYQRLKNDREVKQDSSTRICRVGFGLYREPYTAETTAYTDPP